LPCSAFFSFVFDLGTDVIERVHLQLRATLEGLEPLKQSHAEAAEVIFVPESLATSVDSSPSDAAVYAPVEREPAAAIPSSSASSDNAQDTVISDQRMAVSTSSLVAEAEPLSSVSDSNPLVNDTPPDADLDESIDKTTVILDSKNLNPNDGQASDDPNSEPTSVGLGHDLSSNTD
jgi:hypothetical protein